MTESHYAPVYQTVSTIRKEVNIQYPFDPLTQLSLYFPNIKLIKYSSLSPVDQQIIEQAYPYGFSTKGASSGIMQIYYNDKGQYPARQRFTIAHELGHLFLNHTGQLETTDFEENCANCFARNILSPVDVIEGAELPLQIDILSQFFGISPSAAQVRLNLYQVDKMNSIVPVYA